MFRSYKTNKLKKSKLTLDYDSDGKDLICKIKVLARNKGIGKE